MFRSTSAFDKLLDKATSHLRLEPDWPVILQICDQIRQGLHVQPKYALAAIKMKLTNPNPHVAMFGLIVLELCVKNCGSLIHDEIGTKAYMEQLRQLVKTSPHENVRTKVLELIQAWAFAFRNSPKYRAVQDTMKIMKAEDYKFPALKESDAMFSADTAPEWADGDCCHRCRVQFGMLQRKHHCCACGQVFCSQCSAKSCTLPKFGIEKEVRVCEACYNKNSKPAITKKQDSVEELFVEYITSSLAQQNQAPPPRKSEDEQKEEEELQLALALSQSEAKAKEKQKTRSFTPTTRTKSYSPPPVRQEVSSPPLEEDPELARYLNRSYWENRPGAEESSPSAPAHTATTLHGAGGGTGRQEKLQEELEKLKEKFDTLWDILKCPVCWEIVNMDSVLCFNGHSVCQRCRDKLTVCPTCRGNFSNVKKNAIASQVLDVISQKCKYENCSKMVKPGEDHEKYCCYRLTSCANGNCSWIGPVNELIDHFGSEHNTRIFEEMNPSVVLPKIDINEQFRSCVMYSVHGHYLWEKGLNDVKTGLLTFTYIPVLRSNLRPDILVKNCFKGREMSFTITKRVTLNENNQTVRNTLSIPTFMLNDVSDKDKSELSRSVYISVAND